MYVIGNLTRTNYVVVGEKCSTVGNDINGVGQKRVLLSVLVLNIVITDIIYFQVLVFIRYFRSNGKSLQPIKTEGKWTKKHKKTTPSHPSSSVR
jgi:hypothetical protein